MTSPTASSNRTYLGDAADAYAQGIADERERIRQLAVTSRAVFPAHLGDGPEYTHEPFTDLLADPSDPAEGTTP